MTYTPGTPIQDLPGKLPPNNIPKDVDLQPFPDRASRALTDLREEHLADSTLWMDMLAKTGKVRTRSKGIVRAWNSSERLYDIRTRSARVVRSIDTSWVAVDYTFKVKHGNLVGLGSGVVAFSLEDTWRIWMITTLLESYEGHGNPDRPISKFGCDFASGSDGW